MGDGEQSFCDVHGGCIGGQQILFLRLVLKCKGLLGVDFTDFGLWHAGDIGLSECRRNPLDVAVEIYPCHTIFELGGVFDDLVAEWLILGVYTEIVNNVVVVDPQNLLGLSAVMGDMTPKYVHVAKLNQFWAAWLLICFGIFRLEIGAHTEANAEFEVGIILLNGAYPNWEIDAKIEWFGGGECAIFCEFAPVFEVDASTNSCIGEEVAVHIFGNGVAAVVFACQGLTDDAGIAKQVGVDGNHFEFGYPAKKRCEVDGAVDGQSLVAPEKSEGGIAAIGGFYGFWCRILSEPTKVEATIHEQVLWGCWATEGAGLCVIDHPEISV